MSGIRFIKEQRAKNARHRSEDFLMIDTSGPWYPAKDEWDNVCERNEKGETRYEKGEDD